MSKTLASINVNADTWSTLIARVNDVVNALANEIVTANSFANGATTTGNSFVNGIFAGTTLVAGTLRGGNVQTSNVLYVTSNLYVNSSLFVIGNSTVNTVANSTNITTNSASLASFLNVGNSTINVVANSTGLWVRPAFLSVGNSTVNTTVNGTNIITSDIDTTIANVTSATIETLISNTFTVNSYISAGNTTVNAHINSTSFVLGNTTANVTLTSTSLVFSNGSGSFTIDASGTVSNAEYNTRFKFANSTLSGVSAQLIDSFDKTSYRTAEYAISVKDNNANNWVVSKVICIHDGSNVFYDEYSVLATNNYLGTISANSNSTHVTMYYTPTSSNVKVSFSRIGVNNG